MAAPFPPSNNGFVNISGLLPSNAVEWRWNSTTGQIEPLQSGPQAPLTSDATAIQAAVVALVPLMQQVLVELQTLNQQISVLGNIQDVDSIRSGFYSAQ